MYRSLKNLDNKKSLSILQLQHRATQALKEKFKLSNYQMLFLVWIKGLWTGFLLTLIIHHFISH